MVLIISCGLGSCAGKVGAYARGTGEAGVNLLASDDITRYNHSSAIITYTVL